PPTYTAPTPSPLLLDFKYTPCRPLGPLGPLGPAALKSERAAGGLRFLAPDDSTPAAEPDNHDAEPPGNRHHCPSRRGGSEWCPAACEFDGSDRARFNGTYIERVFVKVRVQVDSGLGRRQAAVRVFPTIAGRSSDGVRSPSKQRPLEAWEECVRDGGSDRGDGIAGPRRLRPRRSSRPCGDDRPPAPEGRRRALVRRRRRVAGPARRRRPAAYGCAEPGPGTEPRLGTAGRESGVEGTSGG